MTNPSNPQTSEGNMLKVTPLQITGEGDNPLGGVPVRPMHESIGGGSSTPSGGGKVKGKRKYMRVGGEYWLPLPFSLFQVAQILGVQPPPHPKANTVPSKFSSWIRWPRPLSICV